MSTAGGRTPRRVPPEEKAVPTAFVGQWEGGISDGSGLQGRLTFHVRDAGSGAKTAPITGFGSILAMVSPDGSDSGMCRLQYTQQQVTDQRLVLTAKTGAADGPSCAKYFNGSVTVTLGSGHALQMSWTDHEGKTVTSALAPANS